MLRVIAFGIAAGAGFQAWRQYPVDGIPTAKSLWLLLLVGIVCAYLGGRFHGRHHRSAFASASATATAAADSSSSASNSVNLAVFTTGAAPAGDQLVRRVPSESAPWIGAPQAQLTADDLDGADLLDLGLETPDTVT